MPATTSCLRCREMKVKCRRESDGGSCWRCEAMGQSCQTLPRKLGRKLGSRNKPKTGGSTTVVQGGLPRASSLVASPPPWPPFAVAGPSSQASSSSIPPEDRQQFVPSARVPLSSNPLNNLCEDIRSLDPYAALNQELPPAVAPSASLQSFSPTDLLELFRVPAQKLDEDPAVGLALVSEGMHALFSDVLGCSTKIKAADAILWQRVDRERLDVRPEWDPLTEGLVSEDESRQLMSIFWDEYHPLLRLLDPVLYTVDFIRARSSLLYSVILYTAAWSLPPEGVGVKKRLDRHLEAILKVAWAESCQSIEIIHALLIYGTWLRTADQDKTWMFLTRCVSIAVELRLECPLPPSVTEEEHYLNADPETQLRLVRNSQRAWLSVLIRDRSLATTRGRHWLLPEGELVSPEVIEAWHLHPLAAVHDPVIAAQACLRTLHFRTKAQVMTKFQSDPSADFDDLCEIVDDALAKCRATWSPVLSKEHLETYDSIARFIRFILLVTPYEHRLQSETLSDRVRDECLVAAMASLQANLVAFKAVNGKPPLLGPHFLYCLAYVCFDAIKILLLRTERPVDVGAVEVELFHLSIIAQAALQLQRVSRQGMEEIGTPFGCRLLESARIVARRNAEAVALLQQPDAHAAHRQATTDEARPRLPPWPRPGEDEITNFPFLYDSIFDESEVMV